MDSSKKIIHQLTKPSQSKIVARNESKKIFFIFELYCYTIYTRISFYILELFY